jgi:hypothetical protein
MLLGAYFESVVTVEVDAAPHRAAEMQSRKKIKFDEAKLMLGGDLARGRELLAKQQQPKIDSEVWACKLAVMHHKYPRAIGSLLKIDCDDLTDDDLTEIGIYSSRRLERLRFWVLAENYEDCDRDLLNAMSRCGANGQSQAYRAYRQIKLYRLLNLADLVRCSNREQAVSADVTHFCAQSKSVKNRYAAFLAAADLQKLFPAVECLADFWANLKSCLSFMGFQKSSGGNARIDTDGKNPNGHYSDGRQRFSRQKSTHHTGWLIMAQSGNAVFRVIFPDLIADLHERIQHEACNNGGNLIPIAPPPDIPIAA